MFNTIAADFRKNVLPDSLDVGAAASALSGSLAGHSSRTDPDFVAFVEKIAPGAITKLVMSGSDLSADKAGMLARRIVGAGPSSYPELVPMKLKTHAIVEQDLPSFLQFINAGSPTYRIESGLSTSILLGETPAPEGPVSLPHPAFEVSWDSVDLACLFAAIQEVASGEPFLNDTDMRNANLCMRAYQVEHPDGSMYTGLLLKVFIPRGKQITERALPLILPQAATIEEMKEACLSLLAEDETFAQYQDDRDLRYAVGELISSVFTSVDLISRNAVAIGPETNPENILSARAANTSLPKKQRDRAQDAVRFFPDAVIRMVASSPDELKVNFRPPDARDNAVTGVMATASAFRTGIPKYDDLSP